MGQTIPFKIAAWIALGGFALIVATLNWVPLKSIGWLLGLGDPFADLCVGITGAALMVLAVRELLH